MKLPELSNKTGKCGPFHGYWLNTIIVSFTVFEAVVEIISVVVEISHSQQSWQPSHGQPS